MFHIFQPGEYKSEWGPEECQICPSSTYAPASSTICLECPLYTVSARKSGRMINCTCIQGYTGPDGEECAPCNAGSYKNVEGRAACTVCPTDQYQPEASATTCTQCPADTFTGQGSTTLGDCRCNAGFSGNNSNTCLACLAGTFKMAAGAGNCSSCDAGTYSVGVAQVSKTSCRTCPAHSFSPMSSAAVISCICNVGYSGGFMSSY